jgi:hypothetical protein
MAYDYKSAPTLSDEFKKRFVVNIKGKDAIKVDGLVVLAHEKGIKSMKTKVVQFPNQDNQWTCIASTVVIGYGYNPITDKVEEVEFEDFADANPNNCTAMTKASYIRMASTRSIGRVLRKYTDIDMVTSEQINEVIEEPQEPIIDTAALTTIKTLLVQKHIDQQAFGKIMFQTFGHVQYQMLHKSEGDRLIAILQNLPDNNTNTEAQPATF